MGLYVYIGIAGICASTLNYQFFQLIEKRCLKRVEDSERDALKMSKLELLMSKGSIPGRNGLSGDEIYRLCEKSFELHVQMFNYIAKIRRQMSARKLLSINPLVLVIIMRRFLLGKSVIPEVSWDKNYEAEHLRAYKKIRDEITFGRQVLLLTCDT